MEESYYAIIPAEVRYDPRLTPNAKLLYGEITALCNKKGYCWATNEYFSDLYGKSIVSVSKWVNSLILFEYIYAEYPEDGTNRLLSLNPFKKTLTPPLRKVKDPLKEKLKHNNTFNTTDIYIPSENKPLTEAEFLEIWKRARLHYDKKPTNISRLSPNEKGNLKDLLKDYKKQDIEQAIAGLFFQDTLPNVRIRPTHLLDRQYFETYLDCWVNQTKVYSKDKKKKDNTGMI